MGVGVVESIPARREEDLRKRLDRSVGRALIDKEYAYRLLLDPTIALEDRGCSPQHYVQLRSIRATTVRDFAAQVQVLFWTVEPPFSPRTQEDQRSLAGAVR